MANAVVIPKLADLDDPGPGWRPQVDSRGNYVKPHIKCQCGQWRGIALHHVHADGRVTASFFHANVTEFEHNGRTYQTTPGCGWHVFLELADYDCGDFPPEE